MLPAVLPIINILQVVYQLLYHQLQQLCHQHFHLVPEPLPQLVQVPLQLTFLHNFRNYLIDLETWLGGRMSLWKKRFVEAIDLETWLVGRLCLWNKRIVEMTG